MKLFVGLGNPGKEYEYTRHNVGFMVIEQLSKQLNIPMGQTKFKGLFGFKTINGEKVFLLKPLTYMNLSGESVRALMDYYNIDLDEIVVIYDDMDLPLGKIRLRQKGSSGGHNGMKSIISHLGSQQFNRIRVGIDKPTKGESVTEYVLSKFSKDEQAILNDVVIKSSDACEAWLHEPFLQVMNKYNQ